MLKEQLFILLPEWVMIIQQYYSYYCCSNPECIHNLLGANPPLKMSPEQN